MSIFSFGKKSISKSGSFSITEKGTERIHKHIQSGNEDNLDASILLTIQTDGTQSMINLQRTTGLSPDRIKRSLDRLARSGLVVPVKREY